MISNKYLPALLSALLLSWSAAAWSATDMSREQLQKERAAGTALVLVDVRSTDEFAAGHVPGAVNIPLDQVGSRVDEVRALQKKGEVVLYCRSGRRTAQAAQTLESAGLTGLRHLEGDMQGWEAAGLPVEKP